MYLFKDKKTVQNIGESLIGTPKRGICRCAPLAGGAMPLPLAAVAVAERARIVVIVDAAAGAGKRSAAPPPMPSFLPAATAVEAVRLPRQSQPKSAKRRGTPSRGKRKARRRSKIHWHRALLVLLPHIKAIPLRGDVHMHVHAGRPQHPASCRRGNNSLRALVMCIERRRCGAHPLGQHEGACPR